MGDRNGTEMVEGIMYVLDPSERSLSDAVPSFFLLSRAGFCVLFSPLLLLLLVERVLMR